MFFNFLIFNLFIEHDLILKDNTRSDKIKKKIRAMMEIRNDRKVKEISEVRNDIKTIAMIAEDFDPELYLKEKEEDE